MSRGAAALVAGALLFASSPARADKNDPFDAETVSLQAGVGSLTGALGCAGLGLTGAGVGQLAAPHDWGVPLLAGLLGCAIGATVGIVWGVNYIGDQQGANGSVLGTSLGMAGGVLVLGTFEAVAARAGWRVPTSVNVLVGIVALVGGPIVGYHLSAEDNGGLRVTTVPFTSFRF